MIPYICPMGVHLERDEPCQRCGATEETEEGCLGFKQKIDRELREEEAARALAQRTGQK